MAENSTAAVLEAIKAFWIAEGFSPSIRDIMEATGISSTCVVQYHIHKLAGAGTIKRTPGIARSYVLIEDGDADLRGDL